LSGGQLSNSARVRSIALAQVSISKSNTCIHVHVSLPTSCIHHAYDVRSHALFDHFRLIRAEAKRLAIGPSYQVSSIVRWGFRDALHFGARRSHTRRGSIRGLKGGGRFGRCCKARTVLTRLRGSMTARQPCGRHGGYTTNTFGTMNSNEFARDMFIGIR
jgi:hypothetical protein